MGPVRMSPEGEPYVPVGREEQPHTCVTIRPPGIVDLSRVDFIRALLDTGSHWSFIPAWAVAQCQLQVEDEDTAVAFTVNSSHIARVALISRSSASPWRTCGS